MTLISPKGADPVFLLVGMLDSIHLARWVRSISHADFKIFVTGTSPYRVIRPELEEAIRLSKGNIQIVEAFPRFSLFGKRIFPAIFYIADFLFRGTIRGWFLSRLISRINPTHVHVNELIIAGIPTLHALRWIKFRPKLWLTNYGSELVWNRNNPVVGRQLRQLLSLGSAFSAECGRDIKLAEELGFRGVNFPVMPVSGGLIVKGSSDQSIRTKISVKGYDNKLGMGAEALEQVGKFIQDHPEFGLTISVYSCNRRTVLRAKALRAEGVQIEVFPKGALNHKQMLELFSRSIAYVGASRSDGISTSVLEAMSQGAIPIQTDSSCAGEWFSDGKSGFLVAPERLDGIYFALQALTSGDFDTSGARRVNYETIRTKANPDTISKSALVNYRALI